MTKTLPAVLATLLAETARYDYDQARLTLATLLPKIKEGT